MRFIEGKLKRLGESTVYVQTDMVKYTLIQMGEQTISGISISRN